MRMCERSRRIVVGALVAALGAAACGPGETGGNTPPPPVINNGQGTSGNNNTSPAPNATSPNSTTPAPNVDEGGDRDGEIGRAHV